MSDLNNRKNSETFHKTRQQSISLPYVVLFASCYMSKDNKSDGPNPPQAYGSAQKLLNQI